MSHKIVFWSKLKHTQFRYRTYPYTATEEEISLLFERGATASVRELDRAERRATADETDRKIGSLRNDWRTDFCKALRRESGTADDPRKEDTLTCYIIKMW